MASTSLVNGLVLFALCGAALAAVPVQQEVISVTVYFESYCPDSVKFLSQQLYPTYLMPSLASMMNITLIPYGKATTTKAETGEYTFTCHHGEKECKGNKVIACVLKEKDVSFADQFKFINCTSSIIGANIKMEDYPINECAAKGNLKPESVMSCSKGPVGSDYLAEYGNKTAELAPPLSSVPTVVFNEKYMPEESKMAVSDFRKTLCSKITGTKPAECLKSGAVSLQMAVLPLIAAFFVISRV